MIEDRPIDEPMNGSDIQPSPEAYVDPSSTDLKAVDVDVAENADQPTTTDAVWKETTAPPASPEAYVDPSSADLNAANVAGPWGADQTTTTVSETETTAHAAAADQPATPSQTNEERLTPLFAADSAKAFRSRWQDIQTSFVDEPGRAVENADSLVAEVMQQLARTFAEERAMLEPQLVQGEEISTEDLRMAIRRYRSFFDRLLSI